MFGQACIGKGIPVMKEMIPEVQGGDDAFVMWGNIRKIHESLVKGSVFP